MSAQLRVLWLVITTTTAGFTAYIQAQQTVRSEHKMML